jgi:hypothetical protein
MRCDRFFGASGLMLAALLVGSCGESSSGDGGRLRCGELPSCYVAALDALRACAEPSLLTLIAGAAGSGVYSDVSCSGDGLVVTLSSFSESLTGTVPTPSSVDFVKDDVVCGGLGFGSGFSGGSSFHTTTIEIPGAHDVSIDSFTDGSIRVRCGDDEREAGPGALDACPDAMLMGRVTRDQPLTEVEVLLVGVDGSEETLVLCD